MAIERPRQLPVHQNHKYRILLTVFGSAHRIVRQKLVGFGKRIGFPFTREFEETVDQAIADQLFRHPFAASQIGIPFCQRWEDDNICGVRHGLGL